MVERTESQPSDAALLELVGDASPIAGVVRIDKVAYDAVDPAAFTLRQSSRAKSLTARIKVLEDATEPTEADEAEYLQRLGELINVIVPGIPEDVIARLDLSARRRLTVAFFARVVDIRDARAPRIRNGTI